MSSGAVSTGSSDSSVNGKIPVRLPSVFKEKIWGALDLSPWYADPGKKIGEVWFEADLPLLVKFVFTSERLSVQVHPDDAFAAAHEKSLGKTEMWYVLRADPGAQLALGFRESITRERLRESALSGEIENLLNWVDVKQGDAFFVPAGTVHAIGAGLALCEVQQQSDITYRLYDYGRPRELHLEKAMQVTSLEASDAKPVSLPIDCKYFHTELAKITTPIDYPPAPDRFHLLIFASGSGKIAGQQFSEGEAWLVPAGAAMFSIDPAEPTKFLRTWVP
jgi:mannose-6-phosphate isomerase